MIALDTAIVALAGGSVVGVPTDTVYGLAAHPDVLGSVLRLAEVKGRDPSKPVARLAADLAQVEDRYGRLPRYARRLAELLWPGPLTLVVSSPLGVAGVRVPDHDLCRDLLRRTGPLAVTSANVAGEPPVMDDMAARAVLGEEIAVYVPGRASGGVASTVLDLTGDRPRVLRRGPVEIPAE